MQKKLRKTDFRRVQNHICPPKRRIRHWVKAVLAAEAIILADLLSHNYLSNTFRRYLDFKNEWPTNPITMAGYVEDHGSPISSWDYLAKMRAKYLAGKTELETALADCARHPTSCNPQIKAFGEMLATARQMPDRLKMAEFINAQVNTIYYDWSEVSAVTPDHHTLKQAVELNRGVCDEAALLKLFALEELGFPSDDIRWVGENYYVNGKIQKEGHATTEVRINGVNFIMNQNSQPGIKNSITPWLANRIISYLSKMETDVAFLNISGNSFWSAKGNVFIPVIEFNSNQLAYYKDTTPNEDFSNSPEAARTASASSVQLNPLTEKWPEIRASMSGVLKTRYQMVEDSPAKAHSSSAGGSSASSTTKAPIRNNQNTKSLPKKPLSLQ